MAIVITSAAYGLRRGPERSHTIIRELLQAAATGDRSQNDQKKLRENPIAPWEVKVGKYRVFYAIEPDEHVVVIVSIGHKEHNTLYIRGKVVQL